MPVEIGLWRVDDSPVRINPASMPLESKLERLILDDPEILEERLLLIGSQVPTKYGKYIDVLGLDADGVLHILELKRDRTPREVVAQVLDYASWIQELGNEDVRDIFDATARRLNRTQSLDEAFAEKFDGTPVPDELNTGHKMTIVASTLDPATERIVSYLNSTHGVPLNVMMFQYFVDNGHEYLARTWLIDEETPSAASASNLRKSTKASWNGRDWYVAFGTDGSSRSWSDASRFGFVSAGGGEWYSRTLRGLPEGGRVFTHVPQRGYVGVGTVTGPAMKVDEATLVVNGEKVSFSELQERGLLEGNYCHPDAPSDVDAAEYVVPVHWSATVSEEMAHWQVGMFANQNSACKLRNQFTIDELTSAFALAD